MGYSIRIGRLSELDGLPVVLDETRTEAPAFPGDEDCHHVNVRSPSYSAWHGFACRVGLQRLFFEPDGGLMTTHPNVMPLTRAHLDEVTSALARWRKAHPKAEPGFHGDYDLARLLWLEWWMRWALENGVPAGFENW